MTRAGDVIVVGAGAAGLAAATALAADGAKVILLERRPFVGGRAYSYPHPTLGEVVDSQHVLLGCCTNLIHLLGESGLSDQIRWYDKQTFLEPADPSRPVRESAIEISSLPAPFEYAASFAKASMLGLLDKAGIARGLLQLADGKQASDSESVSQWYARTRQTPYAIQHFWEPLVLATLNDTSARCSMKYGAKVLYEIFLKTRTGGRLGIPTLPLSDLYGKVAQHFASLGGFFRDRASVESIHYRPDGAWDIRLANETLTARNIILALPFEQTQRLLESVSGAQRLLGQMEHFEHSPFISILLWFDRQISALDHAWLLDTTIQWFFHKSKIRGYPTCQGSYVELVIAGSKKEIAYSRQAILEPALAELKRFFPDAAKATLLKSGILKEARATFSVTPGLDAFRPSQATPLDGLYLAGDWTKTDWPSTMEGAVRSGRLAAGALSGDPQRYLTPDLQPAVLMRWLRASRAP